MGKFMQVQGIFRKIRLMFLCFGSIFLTYCEPLESYKIKGTYNIEQSKQKKVFISEFKANNTKVKFDDSVYFEFEEIWLEYPWWYTDERKIQVVDSSLGNIYFKFKGINNSELRSKGIEIKADKIKYSGYNNIRFELNDIAIHTDSINIEVDLFNILQDKWTKKDSLILTLSRIAPDR